MKNFYSWIRSSLQRYFGFVLFISMAVLLLLIIVFAFFAVRYFYENSFLERGKTMAMNGAISVQQVFENAIRSGEITQEDLFDMNYQLIENTNPPKYHTAYDQFTDKSILLIEDGYMKLADVTAAVAVDINGYLPTHVSSASQPLTGDYDTDLIGNRTKRIFDDETGIAAAQNTEPYLKQVYYRDTGEVMWDISAPIYVNGKHWGAFRVGLSSENMHGYIHRTMLWIMFLGAINILAVQLISYLVTKPVNILNELKGIAEGISLGDVSVQKEIIRPDEIGSLAKSFNLIIDSQRAFAEAATKIAEGDLSVNIVERSDKDVVSQAFSRMVKNLQSTLVSLNNERSLLQTLLDNSVDSIYFKDLESKFIRISKSQAIRFGLDNENDAIGKSDFDFFEKEHAQAAFDDEMHIINSKCPILYKEEKEMWPNKPPSWVISTKLPLYDENDSVVGTFGVSRDITEKKKMENKLLRNQEKMRAEIQQRKAMQELLYTEKEILRTTLMSISEGVIATDNEGFVTFLNKESEKLTGFTIEESLDQPVDSVLRILDGKSERIQTQMIQFLYDIENEKKDSKKFSTPTILNKDGTKLVVVTNISSIFSESGEIVGHVIIFDDITDFQEVETQTALSQKMESIGQMASGIAHEINTPIQYVGDNLRYLQRAFEKVMDIFGKQNNLVKMLLPNAGMIDENMPVVSDVDMKKIDWYMDEIPISINDSLSGVERVRKIVLAMREFSHPSGHEKVYSDINKGIETTVTISRNEWKYVADMELQLKEDLPLVNCYMDEINQVVLNMIINAAHAIKDVVDNNPNEKGNITIRTECNEKSVFIYIADTGTGIPKNIQDRVFDPFFTTKGVGKGTGQGLYLAHNVIVNKHGGKISIESTEGKGTTFIIEIPIGKEGEAVNGTEAS